MSGWEKYVEQAAEALARSTARVAPTTHPWEGMSKAAKEANEIHVRAVLAAVGPLIEEDTRDRMVTAAGRALERDGGGEQAIRAEVAEEIAAAFDREAELIESLPDDDGVRPQVRDILRARRAAFRDSAHIAREIATKETTP